eukprot:6182055-Pleurochrysis_carterae.AAC.2
MLCRWGHPVVNPVACTLPVTNGTIRYTRRMSGILQTTRAYAPGLACAIAPQAGDVWLAGETTAEAEECVRRLREDSHLRVLEAADMRRTLTALSWLRDFLAATQRTPFVNPTSDCSIRYN